MKWFRNFFLRHRIFWKCECKINFRESASQKIEGAIGELVWVNHFTQDGTSIPLTSKQAYDYLTNEKVHNKLYFKMVQNIYFPKEEIVLGI